MLFNFPRTELPEKDPEDSSLLRILDSADKNLYLIAPRIRPIERSIRII